MPCESRTSVRLFVFLEVCLGRGLKSPNRSASRARTEIWAIRKNDTFRDQARQIVDQRGSRTFKQRRPASGRDTSDTQIPFDF